MVLRDENDESSAERLLEDLKLRELAEEKNFLLLLPNPTEEGWNYTNDSVKKMIWIIW